MKSICLLFVGGEGPSSKQLNTVLSNFLDEPLSRESFLVVACDGGAKLAFDCGFEIDLLLGDLYSIDEERLSDLKKKRCEIVQYPREKDDTDSQIGLAYVKKRAKTVILVGGGGGRLDHLISLWEDMKSPYAPNFWVTAYDQIYLFHREKKTTPLSLAFEVQPLAPLSFFPLQALPLKGESPHLPLSTKGLKWDFDSLPANNHFSSQSNYCESGQFSLSLTEGGFAMICSIESHLKKVKALF